MPGQGRGSYPPYEQEGFQAAANKFNVKKEKMPRKKPQPEGEAHTPENAECPTAISEGEK